MEDIARFFPTPDDADAAFAIFDKDSNGDMTRDELEMACLYAFSSCLGKFELMKIVEIFIESSCRLSTR